MAKPENRGGPRKGAGRPYKEGEVLETRSFRLPPSQYTRIKDTARTRREKLGATLRHIIDTYFKDHNNEY